METFWYRITQIPLENGHQNRERERCCSQKAPENSLVELVVAI